MRMPQVISLGIHVIEVGPEAYRMLLMEVGPLSIARSLVGLTPAIFACCKYTDSMAVHRLAGCSTAHCSFCNHQQDCASFKSCGLQVGCRCHGQAIGQCVPEAHLDPEAELQLCLRRR